MNKFSTSCTTWLICGMACIATWSCSPVQADELADLLKRITSPNQTSETEDTESEATVIEAENHTIQWVTSLARGKELALQRDAPMFVVAGAEWCGPCNMLKLELQKDEMQKQLERWVSVRLDVDTQPLETNQLAVSALPSLRVLSRDGRILASREGFVEAAELAGWVEDQYELVAGLTETADLNFDGNWDTAHVLRVMQSFRNRDSIIRERAITQLVDVSEIAAPHVIIRLDDGSLSEQIASLELLSLWKAPVDGIDPWIPESITQDRMKRLENWLDTQSSNVDTTSQELTPKQILETRRILKQLVQSDSVVAASLREQLARLGHQTLPLIHEALSRTTNEQEKVRLNEARYRVISPNDLQQRWPNGIERLASADYEVRVAAASELSSLATKKEEKLLLELFRDTTPFIRELSLNTIARMQGDSANKLLIELLDDPDPNVRVAVLKRLEKNPSAKLVSKISDYVRQESDPDLVVHAIRYFREVNGFESIQILVELFQHPSWRVRSEAADAVNRIFKRDKDGRRSYTNLLREAFIRLLKDEDEYVIAQAIAGTSQLNIPNAVDLLIELSEEKPHLNPVILKTLTSKYSSNERVKNLLLEMLQSESAEHRVTAITNLIKSKGVNVADAIEKTLKDPEPDVRIETVNALIQSAITSLRSVVKQDVTPEENDRAIIEWRKSSNNWYRQLHPLVLETYEPGSGDESYAISCFLLVTGDENGISRLLQELDEDMPLSQISNILTLLTGKEREKLLLIIFDMETDSEDMSSLMWEIYKTKDRRLSPMLWEIMTKDVFKEQVLYTLELALSAMYGRQNWEQWSADANQKIQDRVLKESAPYLQSENRWQKTVALMLLNEHAADQVQEHATKVFEDTTLPADFRNDALRMILCSSDPNSLDGYAAELLLNQEQEPVFRQTCLRYLVHGQEDVCQITADMSLDTQYVWRDDETEWIVPTAPAGITPALMDPFLKSGDQHLRLAACYLLALSGHQEYIPEIVESWDESVQESMHRKMVYRTIASSNNPEYLPVLKRIYHNITEENNIYGLDSEWSTEQKDFYWTIRIMSGPEILKYRKDLRSELMSSRKHF